LLDEDPAIRTMNFSEEEEISLLQIWHDSPIECNTLGTSIPALLHTSALPKLNEFLNMEQAGIYADWSQGAGENTKVPVPQLVNEQAQWTLEAKFKVLIPVHNLDSTYFDGWPGWNHHRIVPWLRVIYIADSHGISALEDQLRKFKFKLDENFMSINSSVVNEDSLLSKLNILVTSYTNVNVYTIEQKAKQAKILMDNIGKD
jgi:hypothetical protein